MEALTYLLKVTACTVLFFGFYLLFLRKLTFFKINRFYLLLTLQLSFIIPAIQISIEKETFIPPLMQEKEINGPMGQVLNLQQQHGIEEQHHVLQLQDVLLYSYLFIVVILLTLTAIKLYQLIKHIGKVNKDVNGLKIIYKTDGFTNCSFFNYIFINRDDFSIEEEQILIAHEGNHAAQYHSVDKILLLFLKSILWFNPVIYLFEKALEELHEYEVDELVTNQLPVRDYANLLLNMAVKIGTQEKQIINSFAKNPVKARIKMLFTHKSNKMKKIIYLSIFPVLALLLWSFSFKYANVSAVSGTVKTDSLRLVGGNKVGKNPKVIIDGKKYPASILTKISPKSVRTSRISGDRVELTTRSKKIEFASRVDIENIRIQNAQPENELFLRYAQKYDDGRPYEVVKITLAHGYGTTDIPVGGKVLFIVDGKDYNESEFKKLDAGKIREYKSFSIAGGEEPMKKLYPQYSAQYDAVIKLPNAPTAR